MAAKTKRARPSTWEQLELRLQWPEQRSYELIRPVVLFGDSAEARAKATGAPIRTLYRNVKRFSSHGFAGLTESTHPKGRHALPPAVRDLIRELKREHPPLATNAIAHICFIRLHYRPGARTIERVLRESPPEPLTHRRFPTFHTMDDRARRWAIIRLHLEGWGPSAIAAYLQTSRTTVHRILTRFTHDDLAALLPRSRAPRQPARRVTDDATNRIRMLQRNPRLGAWRMAAALKREGIRLSPTTCGLIMAQNRKLYPELRPPTPTAHDPQPMPFAATRPHQFWSVDLRYLDMHTLGGGNIYCLTILDNYSRSVLISVVTRSQDLTIYLFVLFAAIRIFGIPEAIVSDGGSIFRAKQSQRIYTTLGINKCQIDKRQPWQNYIETMFNVQRRMADASFERAATWEDLVDAHSVWMAEYNHQDHWAHRHRPETHRSPAQVMGGIRADPMAESDLRFVFYSTRFQRYLNRVGYVRFRNWRIYGEEGLADQRVVVWLYTEHLTIVYDDLTLAQYTVTYHPDQRHFRDVHEDHLYETPYRSPQLRLLERADGWWKHAVRIQWHPIRRRLVVCHAEQLQFDLEPLPEQAE